MPEHGRSVIACIASKYIERIHVMWLVDGYSEKSGFYSNGKSLKGITHWMPLPDLPNYEKWLKEGKDDD